MVRLAGRMIIEVSVVESISVHVPHFMERGPTFGPVVGGSHSISGSRCTSLAAGENRNKLKGLYMISTPQSKIE